MVQDPAGGGLCREAEGRQEVGALGRRRAGVEVHAPVGRARETIEDEADSSGEAPPRVDGPDVDTGRTFVLAGQHRGGRIGRVERSVLERGHAVGVQHQAGHEPFTPRIRSIEFVPLGDRHDAVGIDRHHPLDGAQGREIGQVRARRRDQPRQIVGRGREDHEVTGNSADLERIQRVPRLGRD
ncbi:hypothetical protein R1A27_07550 [Methylobacterium sp. NMS12]|uniref:hypothetical protein n=1 Tax=Methylobacterium sp. NMS12 TaxID=3079766 RepID=UPI003F885F4E